MGVGRWGSEHVSVLHAMDRVSSVAVVENREECPRVLV
jgi:hypothetical protein